MVRTNVAIRGASWQHALSFLYSYPACWPPP
ncbi:hypothetical protein BKA00_004476 [Actinomadura coerulea]|uniref:Uncharacterized protein n=1 Tax=Actinomadura coerulea TaxID=46159 RepID=A0A7X0L0J7_9ACTN|nr:hypothetical protein [Actinomadura coerulea]